MHHLHIPEAYDYNLRRQALFELYTNGKTSDKRYRSLPPQVIKGFKKAVDYMIAARRIEDLFPLKGLNYEALKGKRKV